MRKLTEQEKEKEENSYDCTEDTLAHIKRVQELLYQATELLEERALLHDQSKLSPQEKPFFDEYTPKLKDCTYGSEEYKQFLSELKPALDHHYANNSHHPEHYKTEGKEGKNKGLSNMNLIDILEMICDWKASSERHEDGDILKSIELNQERFEYSDEIKSILLNTILLFN